MRLSWCFSVSCYLLERQLLVFGYLCVFWGKILNLKGEVYAWVFLMGSDSEAVKSSVKVHSVLITGHVKALWAPVNDYCASPRATVQISVWKWGLAKPDRVWGDDSRSQKCLHHSHMQLSSENSTKQFPKWAFSLTQLTVLSRPLGPHLLFLLAN